MGDTPLPTMEPVYAVNESDCHNVGREFGKGCFSISSFAAFSLITLNTIINVINNINSANNNTNTGKRKRSIAEDLFHNIETNTLDNSLEPKAILESHPVCMDAAFCLFVSNPGLSEDDYLNRFLSWIRPNRCSKIVAQCPLF